MYPALTNNGGKPSKTSFFGNYYNDNNPSKTPQEHYHTPSSSSSYLLPSPIYIPLEDEAVFCEFFQQHHFFSNDHNYHNINILANEMTTNVESTMEECSNNNGQVATNDGNHDQCDFNTHVDPGPRKRASKRDRHSKINTAQGPRDRRMRLSLDVAKKLFGLQDLLGFDKASKTVDWLLTKSKTAILELLPDQGSSFMGVSNSASSTSECEVVSGTGDHQFMVKSSDDQEITKNNSKSKSKSSSDTSKKPKEKSIRGVRRCPDYHHPLAKATRKKARARARERTIEKRNNKHGGGHDSKFRPSPDQQMGQDITQLGSWRSFEENQRQSISQLGQLCSNFQFKQGFVGDNSSFLKTGNWNPSYMFNYQQSSGLTHEHQYNDVQIIGKAWEGNNN